MDFRSILTGFESPFRVGFQDRILALGSCFAEHIGQRLIDHKFNTCLNPFGILYNPASVLHALRRLHSGEQIGAPELFQHQELWHHFSFHSRFSHPEKDQALTRMNASLEGAGKAQKQTSRLLITWGTSFAYRNRQSGQVVANCHKLPATHFDRFRLTPEEIVPDYLTFLSNWKAAAPQLEVLLSVSPVRHLRDGLVENQRSKAVLILAAEALAKALDFVHYFPAYELVLDDLRDYRFFNRDLAHPNELAVDYVWEFFQKNCFSEETQKILLAIEPVLQACRHRPYHPEAAGYQHFCARQLEKIAGLQAQYPFLDFSKEKTVFNTGSAG